MLAVLLAFYLNRTGVPRSVWLLSFGAFAARAGYVLVDTVVGIYAGGGDQTAYDATFWFVAQQWRSGVIFAPLQLGASPGNDGYYMILYSSVFSPVYTVFGHISTLPRLQMALVGTLVVVNVYLIGKHVYSHRAGLIAGGIAAGFPYWIILSGIMYRDMFIIFLLTTMGYFLVRWQSGDRTPSIPLLLLGTAVLALSLRLENLVAVGAMFATVGLLLAGRDARWSIVPLGVGIFALIVMYLRFGNQLSVGELAGRRLWLARPNPGAYLSGFAYESLLELFAFVPIGTLYFALVPFPWHTIDLMAMIAIGQNLFIWYPVLALSVVGLYDALHAPSGKKMALPLLAFSLAGIFTYGLIEGNIGPTLRHRSQFQFVLFVLAGVALARRVRIHTGLTRS
jgi:hypothetical protein